MADKSAQLIKLLISLLQMLRLVPVNNSQSSSSVFKVVVKFSFQSGCQVQFSKWLGSFLCTRIRFVYLSISIFHAVCFLRKYSFWIFRRTTSTVSAPTIISNMLFLLLCLVPKKHTIIFSPSFYIELFVERKCFMKPQ